MRGKPTKDAWTDPRDLLIQKAVEISKQPQKVLKRKEK